MTFYSRWTLPALMACGLLAACGSSGGGGNNTTPDGSTDDTTPAGDVVTPDGGGMDVQGDATGDRAGDAQGDRPADREAATPTNACASPTDLSMRMPGMDGLIRVTGNNEMGSPDMLGNLGLAAEGGCLGATMGGEGAKGNIVVYRYTMRTAGLLTASTANAGTSDAAFDTVVAILPMCTANATPLACNDDAGGGGLHNLHSTATTRTPLMMGQTVFIVVGGWGPTSDGASTGDFELSVRESTPGAMGSACRTAAPFCDMGLQCSVAMPTTAMNGVCRRLVALGMPCTAATDICATGSSCRAAMAGAMTTCVADGAAGGACRTMGMACDMGLACAGTGATGTCRTSAASGAACDPAGVMNVCVTGNSCTTLPLSATPTMARCVPDGSRGGRCRADSPRCDMALECSGTTATSTCRAIVAAAGMCDAAGRETVCGAGSSCLALTGPTGTCTATGTAAGVPCRVMAPFCDMGLECSAAMPTMAAPGTCRRSVPAGMACDATGRTTACAMGSNCAPTMTFSGFQCTAAGGFGSACRLMAPFCDMGLACSAAMPTMAAPGTCRSMAPAAAGAACDYRYRLTTCAMGSVCVPGGNAGTCGMSRAEMEPNNTPAMAQAPVTMSVSYTGSLATGTDVDCFGVTVPANGSLFVETSDGTPGGCPDGADSIVTVYNAAGTQVAQNDDGPDGLCSRIDGSFGGALNRLAAGNYTVCVSAYAGMGGADPIMGYHLAIGIVPGM
jgi:hypothetical protein